MEVMFFYKCQDEKVMLYYEINVRKSWCSIMSLCGCDDILYGKDE